MSEYEKNLIGSVTPISETEDSEPTNELIRNDEIDSDILEIVNTFGTLEFKEFFHNVKEELTYIDIEKKRILCNKLLDKFAENYDYEFTPKLEFDNDEQIQEFLKFIEFFEFEYIDELALIVKGLDLNILKKNTDKFLMVNEDLIFKNIEENFKNNEIISNFIRTYNREGMISFLKERFEKDKMLVILKSIEGSMNND